MASSQMAVEVVLTAPAHEVDDLSGEGELDVVDQQAENSGSDVDSLNEDVIDMLTSQDMSDGVFTR